MTETPELEQKRLTENLKRIEELVYNFATTRSAFFQEVIDRKHDIDCSCGYPPMGSPISISAFRDLYDRFGIANRVVNLWARECWQVQPRISENAENQQTDFEAMWEMLSNQVGAVIGGGPSYFQDSLGSGVWEYLARGDELSGIGTFGIILLGLADGKLLEQPVDGSPPDGNPYSIPNIASSGMPAGARVIPGAFGSSGGVDYAVTVGPGGAGSGGLSQSLYGIPQSEVEAVQQAGGATGKNPKRKKNRNDEPPFARSPISPGGGENDYANMARDIYGGQTQMPLSSTLGTDAQYRGIQFTPGFYPGDPYGPGQYAGTDLRAMPGNPRLMLAGGQPVGGQNGNGRQKRQTGPRNQLTFLRVFDESLVQVVQYEADLRNPRFGQPIMYLVTLNDPRYPHTGIGLPLATLRVHWSRVIHLADVFSIRSTSEIFSMPRMQPVFNNLLDLRKLYAGSAEMYWQGALPGLAFETHPQLGGDVRINAEDMKVQIQNYMAGLERWLQMTGMTVRTLAPTVVDPSNQIATQIEALCIQLTVPKRVFMGAERGELASTQDDANWNDRVRHRQSIYLTPRVICPLVNRLILLGILPPPEAGFQVKWPDLDSQTEATKATIAVQKVQAIASYTGGMPESIMTPVDFYTRIMGHDVETAKEIVEEAQLQQAMAQMQTTPGGTLGANPQQPQQEDQEGAPGSTEQQVTTNEEAEAALSREIDRILTSLGEPTLNASSGNVKGGSRPKKPIGAGPNISEDTEGGKWLTVVAAGNPAIIHHVPINIPMEKGTEAGRLRGPTVGPGGVVYQYTGKTKRGKSGVRPKLGG